MHMSQRPSDHQCGVRTSAHVEAARFWLVCRVGGAYFGIDVRCVQAVRRYESLPGGCGGPVLGSTRLLDQSCGPIVDLRIQLGIESPTFDAKTEIVVVKIADQLV